MTVAAVVVPSDPAQAAANAAGRAASRRIVDAAWAGGALPIVVVVDDPGGAVAALLAGSPGRVVAASSPDGPEPGLVARYRVGIAAAARAVVGTDAWLLWPGDRAWVDPETVTSLIEAHGAFPADVLRPGRAGRGGWPLLVPASRVDEVLPLGTIATADAGLPGLDRIGPRLLELGDPGSVARLEDPLDTLAAYTGPTAPLAGPPPDWGAAAADEPD